MTTQQEHNAGDLPDCKEIRLQLSLVSISQFQPRQRPILSQNKAISGKDDCSTT